MAPSPRRLADQRRICIARMLMASGAVVGTGIFEGLAAGATHSTSTGATSQSTDDSTGSDLSSPSSAPTQSYSPPVAQSGDRDERVGDVRRDRRPEPGDGRGRAPAR